MNRFIFTAAVAGLCLAFAPTSSRAEVSANPPVAVSSLVSVAQPVNSVDVPSLVDSDLDQERGGQAIIVSNQSLTAISQGSVLNGSFQAGAVSISDNAFSNFNGIGNIMINTGALNNLQSGMNVTINISN